MLITLRNAVKNVMFLKAVYHSARIIRHSNQSVPSMVTYGLNAYLKVMITRNVARNLVNIYHLNSKAIVKT